ncbi:MAG: tRNA pseudouridine(38-40) synthase TruA [Clostridia bacterium]|nr:tRNA pseudouridine(38-40) synthase TruA [Clostridia bacterium]
MKVFLRLAYVGTAYCGYQVQPNGVTVQEKLNEAAEAVFGHPCDIVGCSRTDSGVHARDFCATVTAKGADTLDTTIPAEKIPQIFNTVLPPDIAVRHAAFVDKDFHARYGVVFKEYEYRIYNAPLRDPFLSGRVWHIPQPIDDVALASMNRAAAQFVGTKDFSALRDGDPEEKNPVRTVFAASVTREGEMIVFRVRGDGFLYHMVRVMTGVLVSVARGKYTPDEVGALIALKKRAAFGATAPAAGLTLARVTYDREI